VTANCYRFAQLTIASDFELEELPPAPAESAAAFSIRAGTDRPRPEAFHHQWESKEGVYGRIARTERGFWLSFVRGCDFAIDCDRAEIEYFPHALEPSIWRHLLLSQVVPSALSQVGHLLLHGGAVAIGERAVALLGPSGSGKSSLSAALQQRGHALLADDTFLLEGSAPPRVHGTCPWIRLWDDSAEALLGLKPTHGDDKQKIRTVSPGGVALGAIVFLSQSSRSSACRLEPVSGSQAVVELLRNSFQLDGAHPNTAENQFLRLTALAKTVPCHRLWYRHSFADLPAVCSQLEALS
jgi:hypothetical protein